MYGLMNNSDLNMYYSGTYMRNNNRIVYVESVRGDREEAVAVTNSGEIAMTELQVFFPETCAVQYRGSAPLLLTQASGRNYKKSYRDGRGSVTAFCEALTAQLTGNLPTLEEALSRLDMNRDSHCIFGLSGRFYLRSYQDYSVPCVYHMQDFIGYVHEGRVILSSDVPDIIAERLTKNAGGYNVVVE